MTFDLDISPASVIQWLLVQLNLGTDPYSWQTPPGEPWPVVATNEPNEPDNVLTVKDTLGFSNGRSMVDGESVTHYGFQVRIRAVDHPTGWLKAAQIRSAFQAQVRRTNVLVPSSNVTYFVWAIAGIGNVLPLGRDKPDSRRQLFTLNACAAILEN